MFLLDTNVISEALRPQPNPRVINWLDSQIIENFYLSAITVAELRLGVALLPDGKKKNVLHEQLEQTILPLFEGRILGAIDNSPIISTKSKHKLMKRSLRSYVLICRTALRLRENALNVLKHFPLNA